MTQQRLAPCTGKVQLARRKGNIAALCHGFGSGLAHRPVLIELYPGEVHAEGIFHLLAHHHGHIHPVAKVC